LSRESVGFIAAVLALQALALHLLDRLANCACGYVKRGFIACNR